MVVREVSVTDNHDGSYTIGFCPLQGGMLKFEVSINRIPAPNCSLTKQVKWVLSEVHGNGTVSNGGLTMTGGNGYCWRVGACYFESGIHTWKVQLTCSANRNGNYCSQLASGEVGIIDAQEIKKDIDKSEKKWVEKCSVRMHCSNDISLTLDMENKTLKVEVKSSNHGCSVRDYQFTARYVSPFFASNSSSLSIHLVK